MKVFLGLNSYDLETPKIDHCVFWEKETLCEDYSQNHLRIIAHEIVQGKL